MTISEYVTLEVVAVSVGVPAWQDIHGHKTLTSIVRQPSNDPLTLKSNTGISNHTSAAHDAQVYALFAGHYDYWTEKLGIDRSEWDWCHWGENMTIRPSTALDEWNVFIGDVWEFDSPSLPENGIHASNGFSVESASQSAITGHSGSQECKQKENQKVVLQVCGGRVPCGRLAWRCGQKSSWLPEVAASGLCGVYLRIISGGQIAPGSKARIIRATGRSINGIDNTVFDDSGVAVANVPRCMFAAPSSETRETAKKILKQPGLQNMNRQLLERKVSMIEDAELSRRGGWAGWRRLKVTKVVVESADIKSFLLSPEDGTPLPRYIPGQFLPVRLPSGEIRCWSLSNWATDQTHPPQSYRISLRRGLNASLWMHSECLPGHYIEARCPSGDFVIDWKPQYPPRQVYISAGIGVTPLLPMLKAHLGHPAFKTTPALWIRIVRDGSQHIFTEELESEHKDDPRLRKITFFTQPRPGIDVLGRNYDFSGRPSESDITNVFKGSYLIDPMQIKPIELPGNVSTVYLCGPSGFMDDIRSYLLSARVPPPAIHTETFTSSIDTTASFNITDPGLSDATVYFNKAGSDPIGGDMKPAPTSTITQPNGVIEAHWRQADGLTILELAEKKGLNPEFGCRFGACGSCEKKVLSGKARIGNEERKSGEMLKICVAVPACDRLELEF